MRRIACGFFLLLAVGAAAPDVAFAQTSGIAGVVKDPSGAVMPGVTVEASSPALIEQVRTVTTDTQGQYKIVDLRPGTYTVTFTLPGFSTVKREGIELPATFARRSASNCASARSRRPSRCPARAPSSIPRTSSAVRSITQGHHRRDADVEELVDDRRDDRRRQQQPERRRRIGRRAPESAQGARRLVQRPHRPARRDHERQHGVQLLVHRHLDQRRRRRRS